MNRLATMLATMAFGLTASAMAFAGSTYDGLIAQHAAANGVPVSLVHRVIMRESRYNPHAVHAGNYGMMQIRLQTARGLGYTGSAQGLLDPNTNLTYAVKYLAGAYRAAGGNSDRAVAYYASGYYYAAKRQGLTSATLRRTQPTMTVTPTFAVFNQAAPKTTRHQRVATLMPVMSETAAPTPVGPSLRQRRGHQMASSNPFAGWLAPRKAHYVRHGHRTRATSM